MLIMLKLLQGCKANVVNVASSMAAESTPLRRARPLCESEPERIIPDYATLCRSAQPGFAGVAVRPEKAVPRVGGTGNTRTIGVSRRASRHTAEQRVSVSKPLPAARRA